jgi:putative ABC transport system substrate-binding protein
VIGYFSRGLREVIASEGRISAFRTGLGQTGYTEGRNLTIEYRLANEADDQLPALAADLVHLRVAVILASGLPAARAAKAATATIPIVFDFGEDPVQEGLVASFNRPGGNITGFTWLTNQLFGKRLGLLSEIVREPAMLAFLGHANDPISDASSREVQIAARALGRQLETFTVEDERDFEAAFAVMAQRQVGALAVDVVPFFVARREQVISLAARYAIPAIYDQRLFAASGGLMSYGTDRLDATRQCGVYVGRILKGEKPADLPIQQPTQFEFVINLKTAKAVGLAIPPGVLAIATEIIE